VRDARGDRYEYRDDIRDERRDYWDDRYRYRVGATLTAVTFRSLTCTSTVVVVNGVTYYSCGGTWYSRGYQTGSVTYIVVNAPPGH
jgi:hypothetical protein